MSFFVLVLVVVAIATWARLRRVDGRLEELGRRSEEQQEEIRQLTNRLKLLTDGKVVRPAAESIRETASETPAVVAPRPPKPAPTPPVTPAAPPHVAAPPQPDTAPAPAVHSALPPIPEPPRVIVRPTPPPAARREEKPLGSPPESPPRVPYEPPPPPPPSGPRFELPAFDWEQLVGVRLFSAIAGIALVLAGIFFLRYSIEHGWLQPPVRVVIGVLTGVTLLVVCERKAARKYPITANALDAAAIAILFSTFFAAHSLWDLIPATVAFGLLALVTATAVLLSIRRESLFIAVLGLLGGFATPALLSSWREPSDRALLLPAAPQHRSGMGRVSAAMAGADGDHARADDAVPVGLGLQVPRREPAAAGGRNLHRCSPLIGFGSLVLSSSRADEDAAQSLAKTALIAAGMPLLFAVYFAAVPAYRDNYWLLFGFLLLVDVGLLHCVGRFAIATRPAVASRSSTPRAR